MNDIKYKWIHFTLHPCKGIAKVYKCYNTESEAFLGQVSWHGGFRKYSFFSEPNIVFESQCLKDIASFLEKLMLERKTEKQNQCKHN